MTFLEYQNLALKTANHSALNISSQGLLNSALGLCGESGEFADIIKKNTFQGHPIDKEKLIKELGDILWYISLASHSLGVSLESIAEGNIAKLKVRYPEGFDEDRSIRRSE